MSRIYKKSNFAGTNASTGIAFGGGGGGGGGRRTSTSQRHSSTGLTNNGKAALCVAGIVGAGAISGSGVGAIAGRTAAGAVSTAVCGDVNWSKVR